MEQSSAQNRMPGLPHTRPSQVPSQFWNPMDSMYSDAQIQPSQSQPQQPQDPSSQQPLGIGWDHPILQQQQQPQQIQQQQTQMTPPADPNLEMYSIPQSWQSNPLHQPGRAYPPPAPQYQTSQPLHHFPQNQMQYDARSLQPSESSAFPSFTFQQNFYQQQQQLPVQNSFQARPSQQHSQSAEFQTPTPQPVMSQFAAPSGYPPSELHNTIDLTEDFSSEPGHHQTIDPQFLNPTTQSAQRQPLQNNFMYGNPAEFDRAGGQMFDYYQNDISVQPQFRVASGQAAPQNGVSASNHPLPLIPEAVIAAKKPTKKQSVKKTAKKEMKSKGSGSESSDDSELEIEAPPEPSPIPAVRPTEPIAAAVYDTLVAVWSPRNMRVPADKVKNGLMAFKEIIKSLRDSWKDQVQAMKNAENQGDNDKAAQLRQSVIQQRQIMDKIMTTAMEMGHPVIVEKYVPPKSTPAPAPIPFFLRFSSFAHGRRGDRSLIPIERIAHVNLFPVLNQVTIDRFQAADFEGSLTTNMIKLLAQFVTVDEEILQKTNLSKLLPRFIKKGGPSIKEPAQKILDNAAAATKWKQKIAEDDSSAKGSSADSPSSEIAGSKRPRDAEINAQPATKRMVVTSNPKDPSKPAVPANGVGKRAIEGIQNGKPAAAAVARPKASVVAPKPSSLFGALSSASKRPGTTNAERAAAIAAGKPIPAATEKKEKPPAPPPKPAFSFGDIMADLSKPKETVVIKPTEERPPETEEERTKRLRKEERRRLRVSWKPDDSLTEVRLFTHDPDEELGPGDGSLRSAGDVKGEGSVLKLHKDLEELEEDDLGGMRETSYGDYPALSNIVIESDEMKNGNFIKRGGNQIPDSPEKIAQDLRESTTLMVFHASPADIPSTPKEAPAPDADEVVSDAVPFGELPDHIKVRQERYFSYMNPKPAPPPQALPQPQANQATGAFDISNILKLIQTGTQQQSTPPPQSMQQPAAPMSDLERTINMFRQQQPQAPQIPQVPVPQPPATGVDFQNILNVMKQLQPGTFTQPQPQQTQPAMMAPDFGAMFAHFGGQNQQSAPPQYMQPANSYEDPERKRMREDVPPDGQYDPAWSRQKRTKASDPKPYKFGLVACRFWAEGKCRKGDNCTFRHDT
ncbi:Zinc finger CCCH-type [Penicillium verhagenii]|uniref:Zinc finger CCCH-type n=1 Tax=Penicillium verhagenii TaxID=1562060 RepID=UPI002545579E|nr:Zinc finger CCCH-type [Penicillium verhagenii]KAJ5930126.1 Zinc finger CCCH-type [Penicillium verhagenii]